MTMREQYIPVGCIAVTIVAVTVTVAAVQFSSHYKQSCLDSTTEKTFTAASPHSK